MKKTYYVYMMTNKMNTVIYTGFTNSLARRVYEHKEKLIKGFTKRYNVTKLVYFAEFSDVNEAIAFEKKIKAGSRKKKEILINDMNPEWKDLFNEIS